MVSKRCFHDGRGLSFLERERGLLKLLHHLSTREPAEVSSTFARTRVAGDLFRNIGELLSLTQPIQDSLCLLLRLHEDMSAVNLIWQRAIADSKLHLSLQLSMPPDVCVSKKETSEASSCLGHMLNEYPNSEFASSGNLNASRP